MACIMSCDTAVLHDIMHAIHCSNCRKGKAKVKQSTCRLHHDGGRDAEGSASSSMASEYCERDRRCVALYRALKLDELADDLDAVAWRDADTARQLSRFEVL